MKPPFASVLVEHAGNSSSLTFALAIPVDVPLSTTLPLILMDWAFTESPDKIEQRTTNAAIFDI
jgi:hypothetical protein